MRRPPRPPHRPPVVPLHPHRARLSPLLWRPLVSAVHAITYKGRDGKQHAGSIWSAAPKPATFYVVPAGGGPFLLVKRIRDKYEEID